MAATKGRDNFAHGLNFSINHESVTFLTHFPIVSAPKPFQRKYMHHIAIMSIYKEKRCCFSQNLVM